MYTVIKNVQIVISLLKEYGIKNIVLSPGSRNVPFVHSVENDPYFKCYSVVDERSAAYFALGMAEELNEPVLISCTSSTASSNYFPAIKEAYERGIQLIALTADRDPYYREQMENQMIIQPNMYGKYCKKAVDLPTVNNKKDAEYCERLINEALLELDHRGKGPVQINFPAFTNFSDFSVTVLPKCRVINRIEENSPEILWKRKIDELRKYKKIMFLFGEGDGYSENYIKLLNRVFEKYNCMISVEHMSNIHCNGALRTFMVTESISEEEVLEILPDVVITFGANYASDFKNKLRDNHSRIRHWRVSQQGNVVDTFMALDTIFECTDEMFFEKLIQYSDINMKNDFSYYNLWKNKIQNIKFPDLRFTNFYAIGELAKRIPYNSILHLSILNSIRLMQFFDLDESIKVYANLGAYGIDGCLSTFLGQSKDKDKLAFLVIGDLSFFYDINGTLINEISSNVRILIINNHSGSEFHYVYHDYGFKDLKKHISAGHNSDANMWFKDLPFKYLSASNREELSDSLDEFIVDQSDKPIVLEVFTDPDMDADIITKFYRMNKNYSNTILIKKCIKSIIKKGVKNVRTIIRK
ncbi:2-succinyl-5-enolpyruvyl-6-hydroxy-3-cyclohexene-1-carboxylic-acid synthase [Clostridium isatidis]|uniref:2-succinyl-5-enolpyruvyl-6-hydroxy-3- cyclohexene-1-carboxylic-acid synthase n=1 Tax=Clostridium isatidis TaxID=182773 RepID=UPI003AB07B77